MKKIRHKTAKSSHYDQDAKHYDAYNEANSKVINQVLAKILKKHKAKSVLDLTCGTGSQVFWLKKHGFDVVGADINANMLKIAKSKAKKAKLAIEFIKGDMRSIKVGQFDAVISIFNAVGHLTKQDFEKAMKNIHRNLKKGGLYIFDINNLSFLLDENNITSLTIDWQVREGNQQNRVFQYSTIDKEGVLASYTTSFAQKNHSKPKVKAFAQTLQIYTLKQLKAMLQKCGFSVLQYTGIDGAKFSENKTERILMVAKSK